MIGFLEGELIYLEAGQAIIDVNGVGYETELAGFDDLPTVGDDIELYIYTYVREDALKLFAFPSRKDKELFEILITVNGIGPKAGLNIINTMPADRFISAIMQENELVLKKISGIGPKTAQRLILELQGKLEDFVYLKSGQKSSTTSKIENEDRQDVVDALTALGYKISEINKALRKISFEDGIAVSEKIRQVLSYLGKER
ncbi:Holliday junction branch migration protein RuvA [Halanaerobium hydrogeniformans]|uniref:Holliday junction branch migration complex subunit RuvA n=1 Tax=Halanaerobium hydrogeniformans TaxID=656519 RepID=E4RIK6_HALHG|nr:Holliday junction branch migration protein RuvA [Halanaerobium hydrogeniformans]ADQ15076.1 Holliday junction DNA helicase RuvA [Halanaerobium hydrogeniformans]